MPMLFLVYCLIFSGNCDTFAGEVKSELMNRISNDADPIAQKERQKERKKDGQTD